MSDDAITPQPHHPHPAGVTEQPHDHGHGHAAGPFGEEEERTYRQSDVKAGTVIVCLIAGIFSIGVCLYTVVALTVWL